MQLPEATQYVLGRMDTYKQQAEPKKKASIPAEQMLAGLLQAFVAPVPAAVQTHAIAPQTGVTSPLAGLTGNDLAALKQKDPNNKKLDKPKAYLNYVFFDKQLNFVEEGSGGKQVDGEAGQLETLASGEVVAKKDGYVYVFTSNESEEDVFFDNLSVYQSTGSILEETHYYPFGLVMDGISTVAPLRLENNYKYNGKELNHDEFSDGSSLEWYNYGFREYDPQIGRFATLSSYQYAANDPIANIDVDGLATLPLLNVFAQGVHRMSAFSKVTSKILGAASLAGKAGSVASIAIHGAQIAGSVINGAAATKAAGAVKPNDWYWNNSTGKISWINGSKEIAGYTHLGKTLTFEFVSYIDPKLWDGPNPLWLDVTGIKLTSRIYFTGNENSKGALIGISVGSHVRPGPTPMGNARMYYPGLGASQNKFSLTSSSSGIHFNFEQHASVSPFEEFGLHAMGYNIVNVAQKLTINYFQGQLSINTATDIFPSASLYLNGKHVMQYNQPSFKSNFSLPVIRNVTLPSRYSYPQIIYNYSYKPAAWYKR